MTREDEVLELEAIARALRTISRETGYASLARSVLDAAIEYSGATRGAVLLAQGSMHPAEAGTSFPTEKTKGFASYPSACELRLPAKLSHAVLSRQETIVEHDSLDASALTGLPARNLSLMCVPVVHQERTVGVLYLESTRDHATFTPGQDILKLRFGKVNDMNVGAIEREAIAL